MARYEMPDPHDMLTVQFLAWIADRPRTYADVMEAWRSTCPRITIWEDAVSDGLVGSQGDGTPIVGLTPDGRAVLDRQSRSTVSRTVTEV